MVLGREKNARIGPEAEDDPEMVAITIFRVWDSEILARTRESGEGFLRAFCVRLWPVLRSRNNKRCRAQDSDQLLMDAARRNQCRVVDAWIEALYWQ